MEEVNRKVPDLCKISGITFLDPTGDLNRIMTLYELSIEIVNELVDAWNNSIKIDDKSVRQSAMDCFDDSIDKVMHFVQSLDRYLTIEALRDKEVYNG